MTNFTISFILTLFCFNIYANDGAYFISGNQLIPTNETDIEIKKEILSLRKVRNQFIEVTVYYEFYNPGADKEVLVGFEAFAPEGDVDGAPKNGNHPYMRDFTVNLNNEILEYKVAYVSDSLYSKAGNIKSIDLATFEGQKSGNYIDFFYVYHFNALFKKGLNIIKHTYNYDVSGGVGYNYNFEYILTAANRWANNQIDDFTLIVENGEFETFNIRKSFFDNNSDWLINGIGKVGNNIGFDGQKNALFHIQKGNIIYQKENFKPSGELYIYSENYFENYSPIPFSYYLQDKIPEPETEFMKRVLRNLPFGRRGYIFKNEELQNFYEKLEWYIPNPNYIPEISIFTESEQEWIRKYE
jgi:hypothetical protein